jgi:hypothetical protein
VLRPFNAFSLPAGLPPLPIFPVIVPNWTSFLVTGTGIPGTANSTIQARGYSSTAIAVSGTGEIVGYQFDLSFGTSRQHVFTPTRLVPDDNSLTLTVSHAGTSKGGPVSVDSGFNLSCGYTAFLALRRDRAPGVYPITLSSSGTETCGTDPGLKLTGSPDRRDRGGHERAKAAAMSRTTD